MNKCKYSTLYWLDKLYMLLLQNPSYKIGLMRYHYMIVFGLGPAVYYWFEDHES